MVAEAGIAIEQLKLYADRVESITIAVAEAGIAIEQLKPPSFCIPERTFHELQRQVLRSSN